jgi:hypothetical protein
MNERLRTGVLAIGALVAFIALFQSSGRLPGRDPVSRPVSVDRRADGLAALATWLEREQRRTVSFRESYDELERRSSPRGNLLIVALPGPERLSPAELARLDAWLRQGNTVLVLAALADAPSWTRERRATFDLSALTGLDFRRETEGDATERDGAAPGTNDTPLAQPQQHLARATLPHPLLADVRTLRAQSDYPRPRWSLQLPFDTAALELAHESSDGRGVLWERRVGAGTILIAGYGSMLSNRMLGEGDNARLFGNVIARHVAADGVVLFDDGRHGLSPLYDPEQFYADPRLHATLLILFGVWLVWVFGATRLRPPPAVPRPDPAALLHRTAGFLRRVVAPRAAAERMLECWLRRVHPAARSPAAADESNELTWRELEADPRVPRAELAALRACVARLRTGGTVSLRELHNLMIRIEEPLR